MRDATGGTSPTRGTGMYGPQLPHSGEPESVRDAAKKQEEEQEKERQKKLRKLKEQGEI